MEQDSPPPIPNPWHRPIGLSPRRFYHLIVASTVQDAYDDPQSVRKAIVAALLVYHLPEQALAVQHADRGALQQAVKDYRDKTEKVAGFRMLRQVAFAAKHGRVDSTDGYVLDKIWYAPPAHLGEMVIGRSLIGDKQGGVVAAVTNDIASPLVKVHKALRLALKRYLTDFPSWQQTPPTRHHSPSETPRYPAPALPLLRFAPRAGVARTRVPADQYIWLP